MQHTTSPAKDNPLDYPARFLALGQQLAADRAGGLALALTERAVARHGGDPLWQALAAAVLEHEVPDFHVRMLRDAARNAAYRAAIERFAPGRRVLDIGTGSGLLAMMAARAGAARVYACEENAMLAAAARRIIAANGLADRITVFDRHSGQLDPVRDLEGGVDMVVSEVFSHCLVGQGVLASLAHARAELGVPGAIFLPEQASVMVALAEFPPLADSVGMVEGFDLSGVSPHLAPRRHILPEDPTLVLRSAPARLLTLDFGAGDPPASGSGTGELASSGGDLHSAINLVPCAVATTARGARHDCGSIYSDSTVVS